MTSIENDWSIIDAYLNYGPIVLCNEMIEHAQIPMVYMNQASSGYNVAKHLLEMGHRQIAYCSNGIVSEGMKAREKGFKRALLESGCTFDENFHFENVASIEDGKQIFRKITEMKIKPTAIFTGGDSVAAGFISEAKKHGWNIPEDFAVVGFDNMEISELFDPKITTVVQPVEEMAIKSIEVAFEKIHKRQFRSTEKHIFSMKLAIRGSTMKKRKLVATS